MKFGKRNKSIMDALFMLALFGVFLICALFIVLFGAKIYKNTVQASEESFFDRTCSTYITEKIRQNDDIYGIRLGMYNNSSTIELTKTADGKEYVTYIFVNDGYIKEYTTNVGNELNPAIGTNILEVKSLRAEKLRDNLYRFKIMSPEGNPTEFYTSVSSDVSDGISLITGDTDTVSDAAAGGESDDGGDEDE